MINDDNLFSVLARRVDDPDRTAIEADGKQYSYADMTRQCAKIAHALRAAGVQSGDRVAVQVDKSAAAVFLYLACLRAGAVMLPLNSAYTTAELVYFVADAAPSLIVCDPGRISDLSNLASEAAVSLLTLDKQGEGSLTALAASQPTEFATVRRRATDLAAILYTSGTTGRPKGAMITHSNLASNALALVALWEFTPRDVLVHALPIYHTHGLFVAINTLLLAGGSIRLLRKFDPEAVLSAMPGATAMMGVPTFYVRLLEHPRLTRDGVADMRLFISGSAPLLAETHHEWKARTGHVILERYGMTETNMITSNPYWGERIAGTVGLPLPQVEVRVSDPETGRILSEGEIGVIETRGPHVFSGYWQMPDKNKTEFRADGFFVTGDLGKVDDRGYVHIVGRNKDLIISGGLNVYPKEVESEIDALPDVLESAVIGLSHPDLGEGVAAVVVPRGEATLQEHDVIARLETRLAKFKIPKRVVFLDDLPRNVMGKVQKNILRERYKLCSMEMAMRESWTLSVLGISGSLRKASYNSAALRAACAMAPSGMKISQAEIGDLPHYNDDIREAGYPAEVARFRAQVAAADAVLFVSPEYNYSIPGVLKNAIDWASRAPDQPFNKMPVAIMGVSGGILGTARAQYQLRQMLVFLNAFPVNKPEVMIGQAGSKFSGDGSLSDAQTEVMIVELLKSLMAWTLLLRQ